MTLKQLRNQSHIFYRSSNKWYFIYSFAFFIISGCIRNSYCDHDQLPVGLITQLVLDRHHRSHRFESLSGLNFFSGFSFTSAKVVYIHDVHDVTWYEDMIHHVFMSCKSGLGEKSHIYRTCRLTSIPGFGSLIKVPKFVSQGLCWSNRKVSSAAEKN